MFSLEYFLILLVLFISPGTPRILIISYSMNYGVKNCIWTSLGDISANFIQGTLVIFVIGSFFSDNSTYLNVFKWIGIIYLVYLAYDIYKSRPENINSNEHYGKSIFSFVKDGFLVAGTSPKAWLFFTTIFPTFIDFNSNYVIQFIILIITYIVLLLSQKIIDLIGFTGVNVIGRLMGIILAALACQFFIDGWTQISF